MTTQEPETTLAPEEPTTIPMKKREERQEPPPPKHEVPEHMKHFMEKLGLECNCEAIDIDGSVSFPLPHHGPHGPPGPHGPHGPPGPHGPHGPAPPMPEPYKF